MLDVVPGRRGDVLSRGLRDRDPPGGGHGGRSSSWVRSAGMATALRTYLPGAVRVLDPFHVVRLGSDAVDPGPSPRPAGDVRAQRGTPPAGPAALCVRGPADRPRGSLATCRTGPGAAQVTQLGEWLARANAHTVRTIDARPAAGPARTPPTTGSTGDWGSSPGSRFAGTVTFPVPLIAASRSQTRVVVTCPIWSIIPAQSSTLITSMRRGWSRFMCRHLLRREPLSTTCPPATAGRQKAARWRGLGRLSPSTSSTGRVGPGCIATGPRPDRSTPWCASTSRQVVLARSPGRVPCPPHGGVPARDDVSEPH